jgi:hypothetical protein
MWRQQQDKDAGGAVLGGTDPSIDIRWIGAVWMGPVNGMTCELDIAGVVAGVMCAAVCCCWLRLC